MTNSILQKLDGVVDLPSLPEIVTKLSNAIEDPNTSAADLSTIMADDPAITAKVLRLVNSAYYGRTASGREITSVSYAIARMGFREIQNIVFSLSVFNLFESKTAIVNLKAFWHHCISVAIATRVIHDYAAASSEGAIIVDRDSLHVAGLLHDLGILVLNQYFHSDYEKAFALSGSSGIPLHEAESAVLGIDHAAVGAYLARHWKLPDSVVLAIEMHHNPSGGEFSEFDAQLVRIVNLGDFICNLHWPEDTSENLSGDAHLLSLRSLKLPMKNLTEILDLVEEEASRSEVLVALM
jgi:putative nucleotidyltransferase with HDIG domain